MDDINSPSISAELWAILRRCDKNKDPTISTIQFNMRFFFYPRTWPSKPVDFSPHPWIFLYEIGDSIDEYLQRCIDRVLHLERIGISVEWQGGGVGDTHLRNLLLHRVRKSWELDNDFPNVHNIGISRIVTASNLYHRAQYYVVRLSRPTQDLLLDSRPLVKKQSLDQKPFFLPSLLKASLSREKRG